jgi:hypothetical protein
METLTTITLFFSAAFIILTAIVGVMFGWILNEASYSLTERRLPSNHPEMFDENGNPIHSELYSVRFEPEEDYEEE